MPFAALSQRDVLHVVRERDVRDVLHCVQLRPWRDVQRRVHWDWLLHVQDWVHAGDGGRRVQHVRERLLPERLELHGLPERLHDVREHDDVHRLQQRAASPAWWDVVRLELPERLLLERNCVRGVRQHVRDVQQRDRVPDVLFDVVDAVPERDELRVDVPERDVPVWDVVPGVQQQLQDVLWDVDDVHVVRERPGSEHADEHVRRDVPDGLHVCEQRLQPVPERLLWVVVHRMLVRCWRDVQRWDQRDRGVHLLDRLHWHQVHNVLDELLRQRFAVRCVPKQLHHVLELVSVQSMCWNSAHSAERCFVRERVPDWLLLERCVLLGVRLVLLDVQRCRCQPVHVVQERVIASVPVWEHVRFDVPEWIVRQREQRLHHVQHQLRHVRDDRVHLHFVHVAAFARVGEQDVCELLP